MKKPSTTCIALLAHVDAGKTTLSESILLHAGAIRKAGRVDHGTSWLDTETEERARGITIFSKQALFAYGGREYALIDTPGHADFSAEAERALSVLDAAVLIISAPEGIQSQDIRIWKLLERHRLPVFVFINKTDQEGVSREKAIPQLISAFGQGFADFTGIWDPDAREAVLEEAAMLDEELMEEYLAAGQLREQSLAAGIQARKIFPCCFGSALKDEGVKELLDIITAFSAEKEFPEEFGARVFRVSRGRKNGRLCHIRVTGGTLRTRDVIRVLPPGGGEAVPEKAGRILAISGAKETQLEAAEAGMVVAVEGLESALPGSSLGAEGPWGKRITEPLFTAGVSSPDVPDAQSLYRILKELEEEVPEIGVGFLQASGRITIRLMGEVQKEVLTALAAERLGIRLVFSPAAVVYKETVSAPVLGAGHFEPLKHYAEVWLRIEPGERGSGIEIASELSRDVLPEHFQRLIMTNIGEKKHLGVLTGSELTDVRIVLVNARAHEKHTEGGDFREAVWRAVRQGLMKSAALGQAVLLEPFYDFELRVPLKNAGRAMTDLARLTESFSGPETEGGEAVFRGRGAVSVMEMYPAQVMAYTAGFGHFNAVFGGYGPCVRSEEVIAETGYDPDQDAENLSGSVFCLHGAGYYVPWNEADRFFHLEPPRSGPAASGQKEAEMLPLKSPAGMPEEGKAAGSASPGSGTDFLGAGLQADRELEAIFQQSLGKNRGKNKMKSGDGESGRGRADVRRPEQPPAAKPEQPSSGRGKTGLSEPRRQYLLVDGYNIIFAWDELKELAALNLDAARARLADILANYQGFKGMTLILVFDAYRVRGGQGSVEKHGGIYIVYTREAQTADAYIEKTVHEIGHKENVTVATSDRLEQTIVFGSGAARMSAGELYEAVREAGDDMTRDFLSRSARLENRIAAEEQK